MLNDAAMYILWQKNVCVVNVPFTNTTSKKKPKGFSLYLHRSVFKAYFSFLFFRGFAYKCQKKMEVLFAAQKKSSSSLQIYTVKR